MAPSKDENELKGTFLVMESGASSDVTLAKMMQTNKTNTTHVSSSLPSSPASPTYIHCNSSEIFYIKKLSLPVEDQGFDIISSSSRSSPSSLKPNTIKVPLSSSASLSSDSFVNGSTNQALTSSSAEEENKKLNLHLGLPFEPRKIKLFRLVCKMMSFFLELVEDYLYTICDKIPLSLRQTFLLQLWKIYFPIHKLLLSNKTSIHPDASYEYHALTTIMYWGRMFPVSIKRMRFMLGQLCCYHTFHTYPVIKPNHCYLGYDRSVEYTSDGMRKQKFMTASKNNNYGLNAFHVHKVNHDMSKCCTINDETIHDETTRPKEEKKIKTNHLFTPYQRKNAPFTTNGGPMKTDPTNVTGFYIQHNSKPSSKVILWLYGGAYLSGDSKGNLNFAEKIGQQCNYMDVFLCDYRLLPEYTFFDAIYNVCLGYEYLINVQGYHPKDVMLYGISSGGGLLVRLLQRIVEYQNEDVILKTDGESSESIHDDSPTQKEILKKLEMLKIVPSGAYLMSPFVDYTEPKGSVKEYIVHDLIVNESVYEEGIPYLQTLGSEENSRKESPVYRSMKGLPPLCITTSEHECVYDHNIALVNNARKEGVQVDLGVWKYMSHVWPVFSAFLPEAQQAVDFTCNWIKKVSVDE